MSSWGKFGFSRKERLGLGLLLFVALVFFSIHFFQSKVSGNGLEPISKERMALLDSLLQIRKKDSVEYAIRKKNWSKKYPKRKSKVEVKEFDPNKNSKDDWTALGFSPKQSEILVKYKNKIGGFKSTEDFKSAFVVNDYMYNKLQGKMYFDTLSFSKPLKSGTYQVERTVKKIDINTADTKEWSRLYGIGVKLSDRIVKFREKLGGFHSKDQLNEVYGIPDSTMQNIWPNLELHPFPISKISLNKATEKELKSHPYIDWKTAKKIVNYREDWTRISNSDILLKEGIMDKEMITKMTPYLNFE